MACFAYSVEAASAQAELATDLPHVISAAALHAVPAFARFYESSNNAVADAYRARAEWSKELPGNSEACVGPAGRISRRLSVLGNPPLSRSAIAQRTHLFATLAALEAFLVLRSENPSGVAMAVSGKTLRSQLAQLTTAANSHGAGDLFIEDDVALLSRAVTTLVNGKSERGNAVTISRIAGTSARLSSILSDDAKRQRVISVAAATLASGMLRHTVVPTLAAGANPACSEPVVFAVRPARTPFPKISRNAAQKQRVARAQRREQSLARTQPSRLVESLATIATAVALGTPRHRTEITTTVLEFSAIARAFAASWPNA